VVQTVAEKGIRQGQEGNAEFVKKDEWGEKVSTNFLFTERKE